MFRRRWSGLPEDPKFPSDLKGLGYFVNEDDEIRSIANPKNYFKFFLTRNERWNERQRFAMNEAVQALIQTRLAALGVHPLNLPLGTPATSPHVPILATTSTLPTAARIVLIVGESVQDLSVLAHRVATGPGGVTKGSALSLVQALLARRPSAADPAAPPAIVLANTGQLWWSPACGRALSARGRDGEPLPSAVHLGTWTTGAGRGGGPHAVPRNGDQAAHVACVFDEVVAGLGRGHARVDVLAIGDGADLVEEFLDDEENWKIWGPRMGCLAILGGFKDVDQLKVEGFKTFLKERATAYVPSEEPLLTPLASSAGNPNTTTFTRLGCPVFSGGTPYYTEMLAVACGGAALRWMHDVALRGDGYKNPDPPVDYTDPARFDADGVYWGEAPAAPAEGAEGSGGDDGGDGSLGEMTRHVEGM